MYDSRLRIQPMRAVAQGLSCCDAVALGIGGIRQTNVAPYSLILLLGFRSNTPSAIATSCSPTQPVSRSLITSDTLFSLGLIRISSPLGFVMLKNIYIYIYMSHYFASHALDGWSWFQ